MKKERVAVGFSGGKDSTASILILKEAGYDVSAVTMITGLDNEEEKTEKIRRLAGILNVPLNVIDLEDQFRERVVRYFKDSYSSGCTPNPCTVCNNTIKFDLLMKHGIGSMRSDYFATGHYADKAVIDGRFFLREPEDRMKSQIYFLSMIGEESLAKIIFPISSVSAGKVKKMVEGLPLGNMKESQDVCFLNGLKLNEYLKLHIPEMYRKGKIMDVDGNHIGDHSGAVNFTIGQRRGTGFSSEGKLYVIKKNMADNTITLGREEYLYSDTVTINRPVFWKPVCPGEKYNVKIRYLTAPKAAEIIEAGKERISLKFDEPVKSVTPGQVGVLYEDDIIVAAGFIDQADS